MEDSGQSSEEQNGDRNVDSEGQLHEISAEKKDSIRV